MGENGWRLGARSGRRFGVISPSLKWGKGWVANVAVDAAGGGGPAQLSRQRSFMLLPVSSYFVLHLSR